MNFSWMAWTWPTALFFLTIAGLIASMGAKYIHLAWLGLAGPNLWWAMLISLVYAICVFRWV